MSEKHPKDASMMNVLLLALSITMKHRDKKTGKQTSSHVKCEHVQRSFDFTDKNTQAIPMNYQSDTYLLDLNPALTC